MRIKYILHCLASIFGGCKKISIGDTKQTASSKQALVKELTDQISEIPFEVAQDVVMEFSELFVRAKAKKCDLFLDGKPVMDSGFYSNSNLPYTRAYALAAFKAYYVLVKDEEAAWNAKLILKTYLPCVVPDEWKEPLLSNQFGTLILEKRELQETLDTEEPVLDAIRDTLHSNSVK
ncbi:TPA: hypothetical protein ACPJ2N_004116 [Vibrio alginolyticus]